MKKNLNEIEFYELSSKMRIDSLKMGIGTGKLGAHYGGGLSLIEIMNYLYNCATNINKNNLQDDRRDRIIFSKGHGTLALYAALKQIEVLTEKDLLSYKSDNTILYAHPSMNSDIGVEFSSGSLGQGLSLGVGVALSLRKKRQLESKVFVVLGDGECDEGSIWEAAMLAGQHKLSNLIAIIDNNHIQYDDYKNKIITMEPFEERWKSFGWTTFRIDGHNYKELKSAFMLSSNQDGPCVIIADTIKGKGISFMENNHFWHHGIMTAEQEQVAYKELGESNE
jgi:transketolase